MGIEPIQNNLMTQLTPVDKPIPVDRMEASATEVAAQQTYRPIVETQGSDNKNSGQGEEKEKKDGRKDIQDVSPEKVKSALDDINKKIRPTHTQCEFSYHEKTKRISITVRNSDTQEVIKEIPPEKTLDMIAKTLELAGILVDEKR